MSTQLQIRRDTAANIAASTPVAGEIWYDTTNKRLTVVPDVTAFGFFCKSLPAAPIASDTPNVAQEKATTPAALIDVADIAAAMMVTGSAHASAGASAMIIASPDTNPRAMLLTPQVFQKPRLFPAP